MNLRETINILHHEAQVGRPRHPSTMSAIQSAAGILEAVAILAEARWRSIDASGEPHPLYDLTPDEITALGRLLEICGAPT